VIGGLREHRAARAFLIACASLVLVAAVAACGGSGTQAKGDTTKGGGATTVAPESGEQFTRANWDVLNSDPEAHKGASVDVVGKIFLSPERDKDGTYFQMYVDPKNSEFNTVVASTDTGLKVSADDYVRVKGTVAGKLEGKNAFGGDVTAPVVKADSVEVVDALAAASPAIETLPPRRQTKAGITITVEKVEFAEDETRAFLTVKNGSSAKFSFYGSSAKAVQGGRQYEPTFSMAEYPELSSEIVPGAHTSGVILFPKMQPNAGLDLHLEGYSANSNVGEYGTLTWLFHW
jgi:hypothetical protein